jgi:hypothetical protein
MPVKVKENKILRRIVVKDRLKIKAAPNGAAFMEQAGTTAYEAFSI